MSLERLACNGEPVLIYSLKYNEDLHLAGCHSDFHCPHLLRAQSRRQFLRECEFVPSEFLLWSCPAFGFPKTEQRVTDRTRQS